MILMVLPAIDAFHQALTDTPFPELLTTKDNPYTRAERSVWENVPEGLDSMTSSPPFRWRLSSAVGPQPSMPVPYEGGILGSPSQVRVHPR